MFHMLSLTVCSPLEYIIKRQMKSTLEMHLVVRIQPVLIADVLFESVAIFRRRNALYTKITLPEISGRKGHTLINTIFISNMPVKCMHLILFYSRLPCVLHIDDIC